MPNHAIDPEGLFKAPGFHQVMVSTGNRTIYIAGQVAYDRDMNLIGAGDYRTKEPSRYRKVWQQQSLESWWTPFCMATNTSHVEQAACCCDSIQA